MRNHQYPVLAGKLGEPFRAEGSCFIGDLTVGVGDLALEKAIPFLAKRGLRLVATARPKLCETLLCNSGRSITRRTKLAPFLKRLGAKCLTKLAKYEENEKDCKNAADTKMVRALDAVAWKQSSGDTRRQGTPLI